MPTQATSSDTTPNATGNAKPAARTWHKRHEGQYLWQIRTDYTTLLDGDIDWANPSDDERATLIKHNEIRDVYRVKTPLGAVYVKIIRPSKGLSRFRHYIIGSTALREKRAADYAAAHNIATVSPIAVAEGPIRKGHPTAILITAAEENAIALDEFYAQLDPTDINTRQIKNRAIDKVAQLIANAHHHGFCHRDLHAGNILVRAGRDRNDDTAAAFVDLQSIRFNKPVTDDLVVHNLAQFNQWFRVHGLLTDRIRFLNRYLHWRKTISLRTGGGQKLELNREQLIAALNKAAAEHAETLYAKRDRRALRNGRYFSRIRLNNGWRGHVYLSAKRPSPGSRASRMTFTRKQWKTLLKDPLSWTETTDRRLILKDSPTSIVCKQQLPIANEPPLSVVCKRAIAQICTDACMISFGYPDPCATWQQANALLHRRIPTARPLAIIEKCFAGFLLDSIVITEFIENAYDLDTFLTIHLANYTPRQQRLIRLAITEELVSILCRLEECGLFHRDLKATNIMVQSDPDNPTAPRLLLVDLDGLRKNRLERTDTAWRMLMRLNVSIDHCSIVSRTDRLRLLKQFIERTRRYRTPWKNVWNILTEMSQAKRKQRVTRHQQKLRAMVNQ